MNQVMEVLLNRKSIRAYEDQAIPAEIRAEILKATLRAPTAGNLMLYSILEITDQSIKDKLAVTCDNQPFIARAPLVWIFLADYQRWYDYFLASGVKEICEQKNLPLQRPEEGDLFLACCDALIAAQNAVIAAESFGIGSCYIGDIMEQYETHREMLNLPQYIFPIGMLVFGYPTQQQKDREYTTRFDEKFILFENHYRRLNKEEFDEMFAKQQRNLPAGKSMQGITTVGQATYLRKFSADFSMEMRRSVKAILKEWMKQGGSSWQNCSIAVRHPLNMPGVGAPSKDASFGSRCKKRIPPGQNSNIPIHHSDGQSQIPVLPVYC